MTLYSDNPEELNTGVYISLEYFGMPLHIKEQVKDTAGNTEEVEYSGLGKRILDGLL